MNDALEKNLTALNHHRSFLDDLTTFVFHNELVAPATLDEGWTLFMMHRPLHHQTIVTNGFLTNLPFGHIYLLCSAGLSLGYLIEFPPNIASVQPKMITAVRRKAVRQTIFKDVAMLFKNQYITIFSSADDAILIISNRYDILKRGVNHEE